ncbi:unnamed protein product [Rotaria socialis]|nr:unnamed protein product [Rotaria socialis]CAF3369997.1 unnamed protein product [Rotaria socialis]CAF3424567.1 unnamed protein product [Rotaria socialis]CAF3720014.1 unnamed protein product [Rotaria socialis]CAF4111894.1 unnamed protein product [Rotaria socialis]
MQSDVLNEQQQLSNDTDCSSSLSTTTAATLIYSGLKLHPKPLLPTISMPGVASPLSIVKKLSIPDSHLDNTNNNVRHASSSNLTTTTTTTTPSSIRLVTSTGKSSPPTNLQFQLTDKSSSSSSSTTNGGFSTSKTYILNPQQSSTTTVNKQQILTNSSSSSSVLTLIPPGTTSPKIQTLNSVTISSTNDMSTSTTDKLLSTNTNQSVFLSKNRVTLVQPIITNTNSSSSSTNSLNNTKQTNNVTPKLVIQQSTNSSTTSNNFWQQQQPQATKIFSIPPSSILPTAKMLSRPVQLIPTSLSSSEQLHHQHQHHHPHSTHITHVKNEKSDNSNSYPISMHFGLSSPTTNENPITPLNVQVPHQHSYATKNFDTSGHQAYIHMQLLPSTSNTESINSSQQSLQFTLPTTHIYSSSPSSVLISTTQRSMDHNNNHQSTTTTITTPIIREMQTDEKLIDSPTNKNFHPNKISTKNRTRLPLQPSTQQASSTLATMPTTITASSSPPTTIRTPKKHKLIEDEQINSGEPPNKLPHYEQLDSSINIKKLTNARNRPISKFSIENTTPTTPLISTISVDTSGISKKRHSTETSSPTISSRKRRTITKVNQEIISNENIKQEPIADHLNGSSSDIIIDQIDDELLRRLSQDFVYIDKKTGIRWIGTKSRPKTMNTLVSRFSWKPKINHYEKYSDIIRTNAKRTVPVKSLEIIQKKINQPWASWHIDRLTTYLSDLTQEEEITQNQLSDMIQSIDIDDESIRTTIDDLVQANIQRHRCFCEQLTQISSLLVNLFDHGNTLRDVCSVSKTSTTKRTKER